MSTNPNTADPQKPRRRWFQFRLRTMLVGVVVLAVPLGYVGWVAKIVRDREGWLYRNPHAHTLALDRDHEKMILWEPNDPISPIRRLLGDRPVGEIRLYSGVSDADAQAAKVLFPEAQVNGSTGEAVGF